MKYFFLSSFLILCAMSCSESISRWDEHALEFTLNDYQYSRDRFFFLDNYYRDRFESSYSNDLIRFSIEKGKEISSLDVYFLNNETDYKGLAGAAVLDPTDPVWQNYNNYLSIEDQPGLSESGYFKAMDSSLYRYDPYRGFLILENAVSADQTLAVKYTLGNGQKVGKYNFFGDKILLKMIKQKFQTDEEIYQATWPLMMRNVYSFGRGIGRFDDYNIEIKNIMEESKSDSLNYPYCNRLGLDVLNELGILSEKGDGCFDNNKWIFDPFYGLLIFPGLQPFDPLAESRFQLLDNDRVKLYKVTDIDDMLMLSRFRITITARY